MNKRNLPTAPAPASKSRRGRLRRPAPKLDLAAKHRVCDIIAMGGTIKIAAKILGCSERAIYYAEARDCEFRERLRVCRVEPEFTCLRTMHEAAKDPKNWRAAYYLMKQLYPDRYRRRTREAPGDDVDRWLESLDCKFESGEIDDDSIEEQIDETFGQHREEDPEMLDFEGFGADDV